MKLLINPNDIPFVRAPIAPILSGDDIHYEDVVFKQDIELMPKIEAEPVKYAQWIDVKHGVYKCSSCGNYLDFKGVNAGRGDANYCPCCGVKMKGEEKETFTYMIGHHDCNHDCDALYEAYENGRKSAFKEIQDAFLSGLEKAKETT